jgi:hypothetical protein
MVLFHYLMRGDVVMALNLWFYQLLLASDVAFVPRLSFLRTTTPVSTAEDVSNLWMCYPHDAIEFLA